MGGDCDRGLGSEAPDQIARPASGLPWLGLTHGSRYVRGQALNSPGPGIDGRMGGYDHVTFERGMQQAGPHQHRRCVSSLQTPSKVVDRAANVSGSNTPDFTKARIDMAATPAAERAANVGALR